VVATGVEVTVVAVMVLAHREDMAVHQEAMLATPLILEAAVEVLSLLVPLFQRMGRMLGRL
jgi:hypothetical protein